MSNKFLGYLFVSVVLVLIVSVYLQSIGLSKALRKYAQLSSQLQRTYKLEDCTITPRFHDTLGNGLELSWSKVFKEEAEEEEEVGEEQLGRQLALHSMTLISPAPQFVKLIGPNMEIVVKTTQTPIYLSEYLDEQVEKPE